MFGAALAESKQTEGCAQIGGGSRARASDQLTHSALRDLSLRLGMLPERRFCARTVYDLVVVDGAPIAWFCILPTQLKLAWCAAVWRWLLLPHWTEIALAGASSGLSVGAETVWSAVTCRTGLDRSSPR